MDFPRALHEAMTHHMQIRRASWPASHYVTIQAGYPDGIAINANTADATGLDEGTIGRFSPYLMRCTGGNPPLFQPWTPDQIDMFAADWGTT